MAKKSKRDTYVTEMVMDRIGYASDSDGQYKDRAIENEKLYHNYIDETENPYLSNISVPWPYIITESYIGKCVQVTAASMPYVHIVEEDDDSRPKARKVERDANNVLYKQKWPIFCYNSYKQAFKYGTAFILIHPWGEYEGLEMPILELLNFFHVWVNPTVLDLSDPDAYIIYETFLPKKLLEAFDGNPYYRNLDRIEAYEGEIQSEEEREIRAFKSIDDIRPVDKYSNLVQVYYYWSHDDFCIITGENNVIRDDQQNFLGRIPVKVIRPIPLENEFYGMSILEEGKQLFAETNENRNQFNDAAWLMLNPQYIIRDGSLTRPRRNITSKSGNIIWTDDVNAVVPMKQDWNLLNMSLMRQKELYMDIQNYSNAFPAMRGSPGSGAAETATEYMGMRSAGELRSDTYNLLMSMMGVEDIVKDIVDFKRMFMTDDSSSMYWPTGKVNTATPEDYEGNFSYKAFASFKNMKEIERKSFIEAMTLVFGGNGAFMPVVMPKAEEWLSRLLDYFDLRNPEQLALSQEEQMMAQQQCQMLLPLLMGGMGGGGQTPNMGEKANRMPEMEANSPMGPMLRNEVMP